MHRLLLGVVTLVISLAWGVVPFVAAGGAGWVQGWVYFGVLAVLTMGHRVAVRRLNPELSRHRRRLGEGTARWDLVWNPVFWALMASEPILAGVEAGSGAPPGSWVEAVAGAPVLAAGLALSAWAMAVNPFFEGTVRIQRDRGQTVVDRGPYGHVRHPGYVGLALWAVATPLLLRSAWAWAGAIGVVVALIVRTALEDRLLRRELAGYREYARRVRFRLLPGVW